MLQQRKAPLCAGRMGCVIVLTCAVMGLGTAGMRAQDQTTPSTAPADNSTHNKAHRKTADQQSEGTPDREVTRKIRRALMDDKSLSTYGHNVKIITQNGAVTLKGPVHSEEERQAIAAKAVAVVGQNKVTDQLTIKQ